ncbi:hypothetical protein Hdeb2414_s0162g00818891 [Helianthus debilis subsp. tardiflorus]
MEDFENGFSGLNMLTRNSLAAEKRGPCKRDYNVYKGRKCCESSLCICEGELGRNATGAILVETKTQPLHSYRLHSVSLSSYKYPHRHPVSQNTPLVLSQVPELLRQRHLILKSYLHCKFNPLYIRSN